MAIKQSKAEKAAIILANEKVDKANAFYNYHKEIIDEFHRLQKEAGDARHRVTMIRVRHIESFNDDPF